MTLPALPDLFLPPDAPLGALPLGQLPLLVLVGVTGVGKSTALRALQGPDDARWTLLPDRRQVTDAVMLWPLAGRAVTDRQERFALSARYRETHPGGMAQALGELRTVLPGPLVFDGLRGLDEVRYAAERFPKWRFVNLHAPDALRVRRLLGRADAFDRFSAGPGAVARGDLISELKQLPGATQVLGDEELLALAALPLPASDIIAKVSIVLSERQHYDPTAARAHLQTLAPQRALDLNSADLTPAEVAAQLRAWLQGAPL